MNDNKLKLIDKDGKQCEYDIITSFNLAATNKNYVVYTDNLTNELGELNVYASIYYPEDETKFDSVESDEEWQVIEEILANIQE